MLNGTFFESGPGASETTYSAPIIISNRDSAYLNIIKQNDLLGKKESIAKGVSREKQAEFYSGTSFEETNLGILFDQISDVMERIKLTDSLFDEGE